MGRFTPNRDRMRRGEAPRRRSGDPARPRTDMTSRERATRRSVRTAIGDSLRVDVRHALRSLRRQPAFTAVACGTLAIGIGATTALFSILHAVLLADLPYAEPDRLVAGVKTRDGRPAGPVSEPDFLDFKRHCSSFSDAALVITGSARLTLTGDGRPELVRVAAATWNLFAVLGRPPALGRGLSPDDEAGLNGRVGLVSHRFWQRRLGGARDAVGRALVVSGRPVTVVGVLPPGVRFLHDVDVWLPIGRDELAGAARDSHSHYLIGRLRPSVTLEAAQHEVDGVAAALARQYPDSNTGKGLQLFDLHRFMVWQARPGVVLLGVTAGLLLLIACANVTGLLLARGQSRTGEMAMRAAMGAPRRRLVRQLLTESVILTVAAGMLGVGLAFVLLGILLRLVPLGDAGVPTPSVDGIVLVFALGVSILTGIVVGVVPALRSTASELAGRLRSGPRSTEGAHGVRLRSVLVVGQIAVSLALLVGAGLLTRTIAALGSTELGFEPRSLFTATVQIQEADHATAEERTRLFASLLEEIERLPGVESASAVSKLPIASTSTDWPVWPAEQPRPRSQDATMALARWVTPGYFRTMDMPVLAGRDIGAGDVGTSPQVVLVTEAVARDLFPGQEAVGRHVGIGWAPEPFEIVGVVGDARINGLRSDEHRAMYLSAAQVDASGVGFDLAVTRLTLVARTERDPNLQAGPIRRTVERADPNAVVIGPSTMAEVVADDVASTRVVQLALGALAAVGLLLTAVGLYGVLAYQVGRRRVEMGIRMAVGASPARLVGVVTRQGAVMLVAGLTLGLIGALASARLIDRLLFGVEPGDPVAYLAAVAGIATATVAASLLPAWRVTRIDLARLLHGD